MPGEGDASISKALGLRADMRVLETKLAELLTFSRGSHARQEQVCIWPTFKERPVTVVGSLLGYKDEVEDAP